MKKTTIGGQALIEGILMRGPLKSSIAVRKSDGEIALKVFDTKNKYNSKFSKLPFIRGFFMLLNSISLGQEALNYSASFIEDETYDEKKEGIFEKIFKENSEKVQNFLMSLFAIFLSLAIFFFIPNLITGLIKGRVKNIFLLNLIEGIFRIIMFLIYVSLFSFSKEMRRILMYHGAEHKAIFAYEKGLDLTAENAKKQPKEHPRCGTSFLFSIMLISILVLSFFGWQSPLKRLIIRLLLVPLIIGISYEVNRIWQKVMDLLVEFL